VNARPTAVASAGRVRLEPGLARLSIVGAALVITGLVVIRMRAMHPGLLYPDGYQYLLMARGIGQHMQPLTTLGPGGDTIAPSADAAAKPLFPALVALLQAAGLPPLEAARTLAGLAGAAVAPLAGFLALRLTNSRASALLTAVLCLASPTFGFWLGYAGPEGLALALSLAAALAFLHRRPIVGGLLAGLAVTARPELFALALAAALATGISPRRRREALLGSTSALLTIAVVVGALRPPIAPHTLVLLAADGVLGCAGAAGLATAGLASKRTALGVAIAFNALLVCAIVLGGGWGSAARRDWPLLMLAGLGLVVGVCRPRPRANALRLVTLMMVAALAYWWKNPGSERYVAILLPGFAVLAGVGIDRLRPMALAAAAAAAALLLSGAVLRPPSPTGLDTFQGVAEHLEDGPPGILVTAAPDAYGVLLPGRAIRAMRPGVSGLILVDGAARAYEPRLVVSGRLVRRIPVDAGFVRPDGSLDDAPALLYRGIVEARASCRADRAPGRLTPCRV
jgi:hypothetical protein